MNPKKRARLALAALSGALALVATGAATAAASSIVYTKDGNVWISSPDGASTRQLTTTGEWHSPTQADDGTIAAVHGAFSPISIMNGYGQNLRTVRTPGGAATSNGGVFPQQPMNLAFSPDGSKIAYDYAAVSCPPASSCGTRTSTFYTWSDRETPVEEFGNQFGRFETSWITNSRALGFGGYGEQVNIDDLGGGDHSSVHWFDDSDVFADDTDLADGELSPQRDRLAVIRGYGAGMHIVVYKVSGDPATSIPPAPRAACLIEDANPTFQNPTWSPDGRQLAYSTNDGVYVVDLPTVEPGDCSGARSSETPTFPGALEPDWGPANVLTGNPPANPSDPSNPSNPSDPSNPSGPADPGTAACDAATAKVAKAKDKLKQAKESGKERKVKRAKDKLKQAKQVKKEACA